MNGHSYNIDAVEKLNSNIVKKIERLFVIAGDATRLRIMSTLIDNEKCVCECDTCSSCPHLECMIEKSVNEIVNEVGVSQSLASHQLRVLKDAGLVRTRKEGQKVYYALNDGHVKALLNIAIEHVEEEKDV